MLYFKIIKNFTDCLIEGNNENGEQFGTERLLESVKRHSSLKEDEFVQALLAEFTDFTDDNKRDDDLTLLLIERV